MAKFRKRVATKGKRWKKGQSSNSNPTANKFREAAKSRFFQETISESNLTKEAVEKHDAFTASKVDAMEEDDEMFTLGGGKTFKTFQTFASDWSSCSNMSFNKLLLNFQSDSLMHKEMLAILAAITEVIKGQGGKETNTEYFAALMTALESEEENETSLVAILNLLGMCMKGVPESVLQSRFSDISKLLLERLAKFAVTEQFPIIRPLLGCISVLLRAQETPMWSDPGMLKVVDGLLAFISHTKPKVRKAAQHGLIVIMKGSRISQHAIAHVARHCISLIEGITTGGTTTTLHTFSMLRDVLHLFPKKELKETCEAILKVMTMNNILLTSCGMQALHGMFLGRPSVNSLPSQRNAKLIIALYDYQPPPLDTQPTQAWVAVMQEAYINLSKTDIRLCLVNLPKFFTVVTDLYLSEKPEVQSAATHAIEATITECVTPAASPECVQAHYNEIASLMEILQSRLGYQYNSCWTHVLHLMSAFFKACGETCSRCILPCLKALAELRDSYQFAFLNELDNAVGSAVRSMGPQLVLEAIPFKINVHDVKREFKRSWLLPILKDNIRKSTLQFFVEYFLPLASVCKHESEALKEKNDQVGALSYDLLQSQLWSLLPSFSTMPSDIKTSFPTIAKALGGVLTSRKDLRMAVLSCLRRLISYSTENSRQEDVETLARFGKNYLPILFNIYTIEPKGSDEEGTRLAAYETIKVYLTIVDATLCTELCKRAHDKLIDPGQSLFMKESVLDLLRALLPYQSVEDVTKMYEEIASKLSEKSEQAYQKKYYRLLEEICSSSSPSVKAFFTDHLDEVKDLLLTSLSKSSTNSRGARLRCLVELVKKVDHPEELVESVVPEAILCVKDVNTKCREMAYKLLETMADFKDSSEYLELIMLGLSGNQSVIASTLLALASVMYHYRDSVDEVVEATVLNNVGILALSASREVVGSALSFIKVYLQAKSKDKIAKFVPQLVKLFSNMVDDCKRHSRTKTRDILARLVRWYGADSLLRLVPSDDNVLRARIKNLGKIQDRKKKLREEQKSAQNKSEDDVFTIKGKPKTIEEILAESDSDIEYMEEEADQKPKRNKKTAFITETADDIVDFTDTSATRKISMSKPVREEKVVKEKKKTKTDFKTTIDGRLIITDQGSDEDEDKKLVPSLNIDSDDDYDPSDNDNEAMDDEAPSGRKRKFSVSTTASGAQPMKYQAGGSGIHRPIGKVLAKKTKLKKAIKGPKPSTGDVYKSKKAQGDVRRKGMPEPFAYLPLRKDALNRRKKMKNMAQINNLVKGAKRGAQIGMKRRAANSRK